MTLFKLPIKKGSLITGQWNGGQYKVEKLLGEGANGKVFLVSRDWQWYALKIGQDMVDLQSEVNALKALMKDGVSHSYLKDVDDCILMDGKKYCFYAMRYVKGTHIADYIVQYGSEWFSLLGLNLLRHLGKLHEQGWIFGDLKVENVLVSDYGQVELIDFGGATRIGKSVKQFTELYDRGYWNSGSRAADANYDLFSFGVLCVQLLAPKKLQQKTKELLPQNRNIEELMSIVKDVPALQPFQSWLLKAWNGYFKNGEEAAAAWREITHRRKTKIVSSKTPRWLKMLVVVSIISVGATIYLFTKGM